MSQPGFPEDFPFPTDTGLQPYAPGSDCLNPGKISKNAFFVRFFLPKMGSGLYNHLNQIRRMLCLLYTPRLKFQAAQYCPQTA